MKSAEQLMARLTPNMRESMGAGSSPLHGGAPGAGPTAPNPPLHGGAPSKYQGAARIKDALAIKPANIIPDPDQPRKEFDQEALDDLAASMRDRGQLQPILVRWGEAESRWIIISGERRWRAAQLAGLATLACIEADPTKPLAPDDLLEIQLVENALREDLKPVEQAKAFKALLDRRGCSIRQLAESLRISNQSIVRALALLDLPLEVQDHVEAGALAPSVAYEVSRLDDAEAQRQAATRIVSERLNREEATEIVRRSASKGRGATSKASKRKPTASTIRTSSGAKITVEHRRGVDDALALAALEEAASIVRGRMTDAEPAAA
ncbi:MAG TPA: ParB/RepB/Spo0J family partition protein [Isosphaeraceae bacterium]|nr:ParB/RepB/Spo0J family partition protein [Isosphaeraceae bacterium]